MSVGKGMELDRDALVSQRFTPEEMNRLPVPADQERQIVVKERMEILALPVNERGRMPLTKDKFIVRENERLIAWEREVRLFLRQLSPNHGHRISAPMVWEWVTGIPIEKAKDVSYGPSDIKNIHRILRWYFGKPYITTILGRKVPNCYRVKPGWYVRSHRPMTLTLWVEYNEGTLKP